MQGVEPHRIDRHDSRWAVIDAAAFASKNRYHAALYLTRQAAIKNHTVITYGDLDTVMHSTGEYRALPAKVAQWVVKQVCFAWTSYLAACQEWATHPERFLGHPKLPKYVPTQGRNLLTYTTQAISRNVKNAGWMVPAGLPIRVATRIPIEAIEAIEAIDQVRIVPQATHYTLEVIYERAVTQADLDPLWVAGIDLGVNHLAVVAANQPGFVPLLVNGRPLNTLNHLYNKRRAHYQSVLPEDHFTSHRLDILTEQRLRQVTSHLHVASRRSIDHLVTQRIGTLVIGKNDGWKQQASMGKRTNQAFVFLPHARFIQMLTSKALLVGMRVMVTEQSYTVKPASSTPIPCLSTISPNPRRSFRANG
jgi:IS605 OrfB family transposase